MKCWAVSDGEYSDYGVLAIFETKEDAEAYAADGGGFVEEFDFYPAGIREKFLTVYSAYQNGRYRPDPQAHASIEIDHDGSLARKYARPVVEMRVSSREYPPDISAKCVDAVAALKAITDRRAHLDADGYHVCPTCNGTGFVRHNYCPECKGAGWLPNESEDE